jgi:hypothetical protein
LSGEKNKLNFNNHIFNFLNIEITCFLNFKIKGSNNVALHFKLAKITQISFRISPLNNWMPQHLEQGRPTRGPRAIFGPPRLFEWPGKYFSKTVDAA